VRVVLGQPEERDGVAHLATLALARVQLGEGAFDPARFAEQHEGLQRVDPHRRGEGMEWGEHKA
jgi:hypothetical protein